VTDVSLLHCLKVVFSLPLQAKVCSNIQEYQW